jgi:dTDP-4-amino-4,6-dideoxygalactose transaminase
LISKSPEERDQFQKRIRFVRSARIGFRTILESIGFNQSDTILLPAYIGITDREGSGVLDPVAAVHANTEFYPVDHRLAGDLVYIQGRMAKGNIKAILVIHYFGIAQNDMASIRALCDQFGTILIEDCAHAWCSSLGIAPLGDFGEYSFGSIHKYLAAHDGGFVKWREGFSLEGVIAPEEEITRASLAVYASADYAAIAKMRLKNYQYLTSRLEKLNSVEIMYPELKPGIIPLNFPILVTSMPREKLYFELVERGYMLIALYYRLIPEIDKDEYPVSHWLSDRILNLPVHQDTTIEDLDGLVDAMQDILEKSFEN